LISFLKNLGEWLYITGVNIKNDRLSTLLLETESMIEPRSSSIRAAIFAYYPFNFLKFFNTASPIIYRRHFIGQQHSKFEALCNFFRNVLIAIVIADRLADVVGYTPTF